MKAQHVIVAGPSTNDLDWSPTRPASCYGIAAPRPLSHWCADCPRCRGWAWIAWQIGGRGIGGNRRRSLIVSTTSIIGGTSPRDLLVGLRPGRASDGAGKVPRRTCPCRLCLSQAFRHHRPAARRFMPRKDERGLSGLSPMQVCHRNTCRHGRSRPEASVARVAGRSGDTAVVARSVSSSWRA